MTVPPISFPYRLHKLLNDSESEGFEDIVSWLPEPTLIEPGTQTRLAFRVHKPKDFAKEILMKYFPHCKQYRSFQRQLNCWCYERVENGPHKGAYHHELFKKGQPSLCRDMVRIKVKKNAALHMRSLSSASNNDSSTSDSSSLYQTSPVSSMEEVKKCCGEHQQHKASRILRPPTPTLLQNLLEFHEVKEQLCDSFHEQHKLMSRMIQSSRRGNDNIMALQSLPRRNSSMMWINAFNNVSEGEVDFFEGKRFFHC